MHGIFISKLINKKNWFTIFSLLNEIASEEGHSTIVTRLISNKANINHTCNYGWTALMRGILILKLINEKF